MGLKQMITRPIDPSYTNITRQNVFLSKYSSDPTPILIKKPYTIVDVKGSGVLLEFKKTAAGFSCRPIPSGTNGYYYLSLIIDGVLIDEISYNNSMSSGNTSVSSVMWATKPIHELGVSTFATIPMLYNASNSLSNLSNRFYERIAFSRSLQITLTPNYNWNFDPPSTNAAFGFTYEMRIAINKGE